MGLNLRSSSTKAVDGGVGGGEILMAATEMRCPRVAEWNVPRGKKISGIALLIREKPKGFSQEFLVNFLFIYLFSINCCPSTEYTYI